jgi:hypothetical protein
MHRPTLILRRFGPLTFGLGHYDNGIWVDHQPTGDMPSPGATMDVVHGWLSCCGAVDEGQPGAAHPAQLPQGLDRTARSAAAGR